MDRLCRLIEQRRKIGKTKAPVRGGNCNDLVEYWRNGELIVNEVCRLYDAGKIKPKKEDVNE